MKNSRKISDLFPGLVQNIWQREQSNESGSGENALDQSSDKFLAATICPICSSAECKSNRIPNAGFAESLGEAFTDYRAGRRGLAAKTLAAWSFVEVASILRGKRVCNYCQHTW